MADFDPTDYDGQNADDPLNDGEDELGKGPQATGTWEILGNDEFGTDLGFWDPSRKKLDSFARTSCS